MMGHHIPDRARQRDTGTEGLVPGESGLHGHCRSRRAGHRTRGCRSPGPGPTGRQDRTGHKECRAHPSERRQAEHALSLTLRNPHATCRDPLPRIAATVPTGLTRTTRIVGSWPVAIDCREVAGSVADHWHTARMGNEQVRRSGDARARVRLRSVVGPAAPAAVATTRTDLRSMMRRRGNVHRPALACGE